MNKAQVETEVEIFTELDTGAQSHSRVPAYSYSNSEESKAASSLKNTMAGINGSFEKLNKAIAAKQAAAAAPDAIPASRYSSGAPAVNLFDGPTTFVLDNLAFSGIDLLHLDGPITLALPEQEFKFNFGN